METEVKVGEVKPHQNLMIFVYGIAMMPVVLGWSVFWVIINELTSSGGFDFGEVLAASYFVVIINFFGGVYLIIPFGMLVGALLLRFQLIQRRYKIFIFIIFGGLFQLFIRGGL